MLDHLGVDAAVFAGMSQGGFVGLPAALTAPDRVEALILIDSQAGVDDEETLAGYRSMIDQWLSDAPLGDVGELVAGLILADAELNAERIATWGDGAIRR